MIDQDLSSADPGNEPQDSSAFGVATASDLGDVVDQHPLPEYGTKALYGPYQKGRQLYQPSHPPYPGDVQSYPPVGLQDSYGHPFPVPDTIAVVATDRSHSLQPLYPSDLTHPQRTTSNPSEHGSSTAEGLSEALGQLKIDESGIGRQSDDPVGRTRKILISASLFPQVPYMRRPGKNFAEPAAPIRDTEIELPPLDIRYGSQIRIPAALIPCDDDAGLLFKIFFADVHPYVPVVSQDRFYQQWQFDRDSISPLLLEAMLACAGRLSDDPAQGAKWLALANSG